MNNEFEIEEIEVDPKLVEHTFSKSFSKRKIDYIEELESAALSDFELENEKASIAKSFHTFRSFLLKQSNILSSVDKLTLEDFWRYGKFSGRYINRISYLIVHLDSLSPIPSKSFPQTKIPKSYQSSSNNLPPSGPLKHKKSSRYGGKPSFQRNPSVQSDDNYDDDFEEYYPEHESNYPEEVTDDELVEEPQKMYHNNHSRAGDEDSDEAGHTFKPHNFSQQKPPYPTKKYDDQNTHQQPRSRSGDHLQHNGSVDSTDFDRVGPLKSHSGVSDSGVGNHRRKQKNPSWISKRNWKLGEKIGSGSFGEVFQAMNEKVSSSNFVLTF
jgi:hypothetical protein